MYLIKKNVQQINHSKCSNVEVIQYTSHVLSYVENVTYVAAVCLHIQATQ